MKTPRTSALPPLYTQVIGSFPRPVAVRDALARRDEWSPERFTVIMDDLVRACIRMQGLAGLDVVSDGEWRRTNALSEFLQRTGAIEPVRTYIVDGETRLAEVVVKRMVPKGSVFKADADFLVNNTARLTKFAIPSPFVLAVRYWHEDYSKQAYPTLQHFMDHLVEVLSAEVHALVSAGIDIIQLDDPALTYFCDRRLLSKGDNHADNLRRDWNIDTQFPLAVAAINRIAETAAGKAEIHLHCCHSVYHRRSNVVGDYKPILPRLKDCKIDRINLEFAYRGTGNFDDLALLPPHVDVGMGVVDVRSATIPTIDDIENLVLAGTEILDPSRIALNPDCGFAPHADEPPTIDEAYQKLRNLVLAAKNLRTTLQLA
jgi:5-methyltetrahydropteroyltriglutamate--homocysteine methyltransferase